MLGLLIVFFARKQAIVDAYAGSDSVGSVQEWDSDSSSVDFEPVEQLKSGDSHSVEKLIDTNIADKQIKAAPIISRVLRLSERLKSMQTATPEANELSVKAMMVEARFLNCQAKQMFTDDELDEVHLNLAFARLPNLKTVGSFSDQLTDEAKTAAKKEAEQLLERLGMSFFGQSKLPAHTALLEELQSTIVGSGSEASQGDCDLLRKLLLADAEFERVRAGSRLVGWIQLPSGSTLQAIVDCAIVGMLCTVFTICGWHAAIRVRIQESCVELSKRQAGGRPAAAADARSALLENGIQEAANVDQGVQNVDGLFDWLLLFPS